MPRLTTCDAFTDDAGRLVGTTGEGENAMPVGDARDLCASCCPVEHPIADEVDDADADNEG